MRNLWVCFIIILTLIVFIEVTTILLYHASMPERQTFDTPTFDDNPWNNKPTTNQHNFSCNNHGLKELGFVHIPKTAGSSIEKAAFHDPSRRRWGYFAWRGNQPTLKGIKEKWLRKKYLGPEYRKDITNTLWHFPPFVLPFITRNNTPYEGQDLFAVIRNPFTRIASEIQYRSRDKGREKLLNKTGVNRRTQQDLQKLLSCSREMKNASTLLDPKGLNCLFTKQGHLIPQWQFFYDRFSKQRQIRYLLHFERLSEDFSDLMESYNLNISMGGERKRPTNYKDVKDGLFRDAKDFDETTRLLIVELYRNDFELGGYSLNVSDTASFSMDWKANGNSKFWELPCQTNLEFLP